MLTIKNLRKRYGNFQALDGLNLEVADGELFGFVGRQDDDAQDSCGTSRSR